MLRLFECLAGLLPVREVESGIAMTSSACVRYVVLVSCEVGHLPSDKFYLANK